MKQHRYRVTLEHLADAKGAPSTYDAPLRFEVGNHDDVFAIVERMRTRADLAPEAATALAVGLKPSAKSCSRTGVIPCSPSSLRISATS